uniref:Neur_chan_LBD domain-containing protein n=1 Tax=Heterorhabditis bacteriophora TaxID=37862 RepID=A0A1I7WKE6_HETBA
MKLHFTDDNAVMIHYKVDFSNIRKKTWKRENKVLLYLMMTKPTYINCSQNILDLNSDSASNCDSSQYNFLSSVKYTTKGIKHSIILLLFCTLPNSLL